MFACLNMRKRSRSRISRKQISKSLRRSRRRSRRKSRLTSHNKRKQSRKPRQRNNKKSKYTKYSKRKAEWVVPAALGASGLALALAAGGIIRGASGASGASRAKKSKEIAKKRTPKPVAQSRSRPKRSLPQIVQQPRPATQQAFRDDNSTINSILMQMEMQRRMQPPAPMAQPDVEAKSSWQDYLSSSVRNVANTLANVGDWGMSLARTKDYIDQSRFNRSRALRAQNYQMLMGAGQALASVPDWYTRNFESAATPPQVQPVVQPPPMMQAPPVMQQPVQAQQFGNIYARPCRDAAFPDAYRCPPGTIRAGRCNKLEDCNRPYSR